MRYTSSPCMAEMTVLMLMYLVIWSSTRARRDPGQ